MSSPIDNNRDRLLRIYTDYREAWMSREYYACRLAFFKRCNLWYEIVLALGASGSVIAGWYIWQTSTGKPVWAIISGAAAILAIVKPILRVADEIERYSKLHVGYTDLAYDYKQLVDEIRATGGTTVEMRETLKSAEDRFKKLALQDDPKPSVKLLRKCQGAVKRTALGFDEWYPKPNA